MERLAGPDLPEDEWEPPDTEPAGLLQLPPGGPPTTLATDRTGSRPEWDDHDFQYGNHIGVLGRAARAVLAFILIGTTLVFPNRWQLKLTLIGIALICVWIALFAEGLEQSAYRGWQWLQRRRSERRLARSAHNVRRAA